MEAKDLEYGSDEAKRLRQIKREAKREKQRLANGDRAAKMHLARLEHESFEGHFADPFPKQPFHVGCSGWFYWDWRGLFYPEALPRKDWFRYYSENFDTVELNAPFYSWPTLATVKTWMKQAEPSPEFVYTIKVSELITHVKQFVDTAELVLDFGYIADLLGPRFGCFLYQLPPSFSFTPARLEAITIQLDPRRRNVVEFRHASWWNDTVYEAFRSHGIIFCSCSAPRLPDQLVKTADELYIRFHGKGQWYLHDYSRDELEVWADRVRGSGAQQTWAYFNNDREGYAIQNARVLLSLLNQ